MAGRAAGAGGGQGRPGRVTGQAGDGRLGLVGPAAATDVARCGTAHLNAAPQFGSLERFRRETRVVSLVIAWYGLAWASHRFEVSFAPVGLRPAVVCPPRASPRRRAAAHRRKPPALVRYLGSGS